MKKETIITAYEVYSEEQELALGDANLLAEAKSVLPISYAPYSKFQVGAALILETGEIVKGMNQENASYPLCICAERVALYNAGTQYPGVKIISIAITAKNAAKPLVAPVSPCGACRQVIREFESKQGHPIRIILSGEQGETFIFDSIVGLLPLGFDGDLI